MANLSVSAVVLTKNEESNIKDCIESFKFCDEIIVVDDNSKDETTSIAEKLGAKVYKRYMDMNYSEQSNFGMEKAQNKWVLFLDADERITDNLSKDIVNTLGRNEQIKGYYFRRVDYMWGSWLKHGESGYSTVLRLVRKGSGNWVRRVHPRFEIRGRTSEFSYPIKHYPHQSVGAFIESVDRWSTWHAVANNEEGKSSSVIKILFWPAAHFVKNFIIRMGFLDGIQGFVFAIVMSFHSYLAWSKLWMLQKRFIKN